MKTIQRCVMLAAAVVALAHSEASAQIDLRGPVTEDNYEAFVDYAKDNAPSEDAFIAVQRIGQLFVRRGDYANAAVVYRRFQSLFPEDKRFQRIVEILTRDEAPIKVMNLGPGVNTQNLESSPVISVNGRRLYFSAMFRPDSSFGGQDIMVSDLQADSTWGRARNLGPVINTRRDEAPFSISADGMRMILFGNYPGGLGEGDLFEAYRTADGWRTPTPLPTPINSPYFDCDGQLTADGRALLFASDRPGGIGEYHKKDLLFHGDVWGNTDIYVCEKTDTGWSRPINLGEVINTPFAERSPFLHPDGRTLYFSSDGHGGLGLLDVYKTVRLREDSWTEWSEPVNLGRQINTADDDMDYSITTSGTMALFASSNRSDGFGNGDLYAAMLPPEARPDYVATVSGTVTDVDGKPLEAELRWQDLQTGRILGTLNSDPVDGSYYIVLPLGRNYGYFAEREGHYPASSNIDLREVDSATNVREDITLMSLERMAAEGSAVRLNNIFFEYDSHNLMRESHPELDRLAAFLKDNPSMRVEISGHTDDVGSDEYNLKLSQQRARSVVGYLIRAGVNASNLEAKGYGKLRPVAPNTSDAGRAKNRRVEVKILGDG